MYYIRIKRRYQKMGREPAEKVIRQQLTTDMSGMNKVASVTGQITIPPVTAHVDGLFAGIAATADSHGDDIAANDLRLPIWVREFENLFFGQHTRV